MSTTALDTPHPCEAVGHKAKTVHCSWTACLCAPGQPLLGGVSAHALQRHGVARKNADGAFNVICGQYVSYALVTAAQRCLAKWCLCVLRARDFRVRFLGEGALVVSRPNRDKGWKVRGLPCAERRAKPIW